MAIVGNPPNYILMFGGVSEEPLDGALSVYKIKKTINDLWVYHTGTRMCGGGGTTPMSEDPTT